jgi:hypothetical protein
MSPKGTDQQIPHVSAVMVAIWGEPGPPSIAPVSCAAGRPPPVRLCQLAVDAPNGLFDTEAK